MYLETPYKPFMEELIKEIISLDGSYESKISFTDEEPLKIQKYLKQLADEILCPKLSEFEQIHAQKLGSFEANFRNLCINFCSKKLMEMEKIGADAEKLIYELQIETKVKKSVKMAKMKHNLTSMDRFHLAFHQFAEHLKGRIFLTKGN